MVRIRERIEDFEVEEVALYPPVGDGDHTYLWIEKRGRTTVSIAEELARLADVSTLDVGFAGRKDRWAVARQWFSVRGLDPGAAARWELEDAQILEALKHRNKLRPGDLNGNRFRLMVRAVTPGQEGSARSAWSELLSHGMVNRFGRQRFGRSGDNAGLGAALFRGDRVPGSNRHRRFLATAFQSAIFNDVLLRRPGRVNEVLVGDVAVIHARGGLFVVDDAGVEAERLRAFEISPTGPLVGPKMRRPQGEAARIENEAFAAAGLELETGLEAARRLRLFGSRRALRAEVTEATFAGEAPDLELCFTLPAGSFATVLIDQVFAGVAVEEGPQK